MSTGTNPRLLAGSSVSTLVAATSNCKKMSFVLDPGFRGFAPDGTELTYLPHHNLTVIGEAANHVPSEITGQHLNIPWQKMIESRNFSVHAYWNLHPSVIWDTIQNDLPPLVADIFNRKVERDISNGGINRLWARAKLVVTLISPAGGVILAAGESADGQRTAEQTFKNIQVGLNGTSITSSIALPETAH